MTSKLPEPFGDDSLRVVRDAMQTLQNERVEFEQFVGETLDVLETLRVTLSTQDEEIAARSSALADKETGLNTALDKLEASTADNAEHQAQLTRLESESTELRKDRDQLQEKLDAATSELSSMADLLELVESAESELKETRARLEEAQLSLAEREDSQELTELRRQNDQLKRERAELEQALQQSGNGTAQVVEKAREQGKELSSYRQKWSDEIEGMKAALKSPAEPFIDQASGPTDDHSAPFVDEEDVLDEVTSTHEPIRAQAQKDERERTEAKDAGHDQSAKSSDPVVGSVLSQLAKLGNSR